MERVGNPEEYVLKQSFDVSILQEQALGEVY
jgi:hypothetical protein